MRSNELSRDLARDRDLSCVDVFVDTCDAAAGVFELAIATSTASASSLTAISASAGELIEFGLNPDSGTGNSLFAMFSCALPFARVIFSASCYTNVEISSQNNAVVTRDSCV